MTTSRAWRVAIFGGLMALSLIKTLGCGWTKQQGVGMTAPSGLTYSTNPATYYENTAISANNPTVSGSPTSYSVLPALPTGLSLNTGTGVITGTPTALTASAVYVVTATNAGGSTTCNLTVAVVLLSKSIAGLTIHLRSDLGVTSSSGAISIWADQSGNGNDFVQTVGGSKPTLVNSVVNNLPVIQFNPAATQQFVFAASGVLDATKKHTYFVVSRPRIVQDGAPFGNIESAGQFFRYRSNAGSPEVRYGLVGGGVLDVSDVSGAGKFSYLTASQDGTSGAGGVVVIRQNGSVLGTSPSGVSVAADKNLTLGAVQQTTPNSPLDGDIAEVIIYEGSSILTGPQVTTMESYLSTRYAIGGAAWGPQDISGLRLWLRGDRGVTLTSGRVSIWADQSGNGNDFVQTSAGSRPLQTANAGTLGQAAIEFAVLDTPRLTTTASLAQTSLSAFIIYQMTAITGGGSGYSNLVSFTDGVEAWAIDGSALAPEPAFMGAHALGAGLAMKFSGVDGLDTNKHLLQYTWDGASEVDAASFSGSFDNVAKTVVNTGAYGGRTGTTIGDRATGGFYLDGFIAEIILYDGVLSAGNKASVMSYLATRYGF